MDDKQSSLPSSLLELGKSRGFLFYTDIESQIPGSAISERLREEIVAQLIALGVAVYPEAPEAATVGMLVEVGTPEEVSLSQLGTGANFDSSVGCRFSFICDKQWSELAEDKNDPSARYCGECKRSVQFCLTKEEASEAIERKQCVALMFQHVLVKSQ